MKPPPIPPERIAYELLHGEVVAERERLRRTFMVAERERRDRRGYLIAFVVALCFIAALAGFAWVLIARHAI